MPHILVVEDDPEVQQVVCEFLRETGHRVLAATSAEQARRLLANEAVDLLVIDCLMSGERGSSLAEHVATLGIPAILTSGDLKYQEASAQSSVPFLNKPFRLTELDEAIARALAAARA